MEIQEFITDTHKGTIPVSDLTAIATDRRAFGDDVIAAFKTQIELRSRAAQAVLTDAEQAGRDTLMASEQRSYDAAMRERDSILSLQQAVERRTEQRAQVPGTQVVTTETRVEAGPVLTREQPMRAWLERRGGYQYAGERGSDRASLGRIVLALATGSPAGLSPFEHRALAENAGTAGFTVPEILATPFIDRIRNNMVVIRAGAQTVPMSSDTLHIARLVQPGGSPGPAWKVENDPISESGLTLERVTFTARTLPMLMKLSVELSEDSVNIDAIIEREMAQALALEVDRVALLGSGTPPEPSGITTQSDVPTGSLGSPPPGTDWDRLCDGAGTLWAANHEPNACLYGATFATAIAKYKSTVDAQPLRMPEALSGIRQYRTNQLSTDVIVGDFTQLMVGMRTSFRLETSRVAGDAFGNLQIAVRAYLRADVQLTHPQAFVVLS